MTPRNGNSSALRLHKDIISAFSETFVTVIVCNSSSRFGIGVVWESNTQQDGRTGMGERRANTIHCTENRGDGGHCFREWRSPEQNGYVGT